MITLSSDSETEVEILGSYSNKNEPLPLSSVRVQVEALNIKLPANYIDLRDPKWAPPELNINTSRLDLAAPLVDLTEEDLSKSTEKEDSFPPDDCQIREKITNTHQLSVELDFKKSSRNPTQVCCELKPKWEHLKSPKQKLTKDSFCHHTPSVVLEKHSFLESHVSELLTSEYTVCLRQTGKNVSLKLKERGSSCQSDFSGHLSNTTTLYGLEPSVESSLVEEKGQTKATALHEEAPLTPRSQADYSHLEHQLSLTTSTERNDEKALSVIMPSPAHASSSLDKAQSFLSNELRSFSPSLPIGTSTVQPELNDSRNNSPARAPTFQCDDISSLSHTSFKPESLRNTGLDSISDEGKALNIHDSLCCSLSCESPLSEPKVTDLDEDFPYQENYGIDSPMSFSWKQSNEQEEINAERLELDCTSATDEDRHFVCPVALKKLMVGASLTDDEEGSRVLQGLCRQSLSLVYSTIDERYPEGTLQLLSDLLQPGYYPPKDITSHLLRGILLDPQSSHHICVQAFNLLMRTQRHHITDKWTVPWDWELLTTVMDNQQENQCEVVCMFLEYVVQTLEDDFQAKQTTSALYESIAKVMLSFDQQFLHVRDLSKWLFSAIVKSTGHNEIREAQERNEQIRMVSCKMVSIFQRMLSVALEVDGSPAICSAKLSQEFFHMLISHVPSREQRMLLLESLENMLLRCKLVEQLLQYACPLKTSLPMSLSLLLHFLKNCTLEPDPKDGTEKWQKWEELINLLWMLLFSYGNAMKGCLCGSKTDQRDNLVTFIYKPEDMVSKSAVCEAVEAFLLRSKDDLGEALPLHVEESLTYLQDCFLDVCHC